MLFTPYQGCLNTLDALQWTINVVFNGQAKSSYDNRFLGGDEATTLLMREGGGSIFPDCSNLNKQPCSVLSFASKLIEV